MRTETVRLDLYKRPHRPIKEDDGINYLNMFLIIKFKKKAHLCF